MRPRTEISTPSAFCSRRAPTPKARSGDGSFQKVKAGSIALGNWTPLTAAVSMATPELVKALLDAGADVNVPDVRGMTPLMLAVANDRQNIDVIRLLIARGADVNAKSLAGETALDWAVKTGPKPAIDAIQGCGRSGDGSRASAGSSCRARRRPDRGRAQPRTAEQSERGVPPPMAGALRATLTTSSIPLSTSRSRKG